MVATTDLKLGDRCEKQTQSHQNFFAGRIEKITQSQQQLLHITNEAVRQGSVQSFESRALAITTVAFPNGHWPRNLAPWPSSRISFASIHLAHGQRLEALKYALNGQLLLDYRSGPKWVHHLYDLVQHFSGLLMEQTTCRDTGFPTEPQVRDVMYSYLHELKISARKTFGEETGYAQAIASWYNDCVKEGSAPELITRDFIRQFEEAQGKLLIWAGVELERAIALT